MTMQISEPYNLPENDMQHNQRNLLTGLLVGPVVYIIYFFAVYFWVEAACAETLLPIMWLGFDGIELGVMGITLVAILLILVIAFYVYLGRKPAETHDAQENRRFVQKVGLWLSVFFVLVTLVTGVPIVFLERCTWV